MLKLSINHKSQTLKTILINHRHNVVCKVDQTNSFISGESSISLKLQKLQHN